MDSKNQITSAFSWQIVNISSQAILQFAFIMLSARLLPQEVHGVFAIINAFIFVMSIASEGGVSSAIIQRKEINKNHISISFYITIFLSLLMCGLLLIFAQPVADFYEGKITSTQIRVASLIFVFKAIGAVSRAFLVKNFKFKKLFIANNVSFLIGNIIVMVVLSLLGYGVYALILGFIATQFAQSLLYFYFARHSLKFYWSKEEFKQITYFGSSFILLRNVNYLSSQADKLLIGKFFNVTPLSIFEKGQYLAKMPPKYIGNSIDSVMFAALSKMDEKPKKRFFNTILLVVTLLSVYLAIVFYFNSKLVITILLGENWLNTIPYLELFSFLIPTMLLARLGDVVVRAENKMFQSLPIKIGFLVLVVLSVLLFKQDSLVEVTKYIVLSNWIHAIAMLILSKYILNLKFFTILKSLIAGFGLAAIFIVKYYFMSQLISSEWLYFITNGITDLLIFSLILYLLKDKKQVLMLKNIILNKFKSKKES